MIILKRTSTLCLVFVVLLSCLQVYKCLKPIKRFTRQQLANIPKRLVREATTVRECGSNATVTSFVGKIVSPNYPSSYYPDLECQWLLTAARQAVIILQINKLAIEAFANCSYDYLDVYAGSTTDDPLLRRICGKVSDYKFEINSTEVLLVFNSDSTFEESGFEIQYSLQSSSSECDRELTEAQGIVRSPGYPEKYPTKSDCFTSITVPESEVIYFTFEVLKLEFDENCAYDYVAIYDGPTEDSTLLGKFCSSKSPISIKSSNNSALIHFHSDDILSEQGFVLNYATEGYVGKMGNIGDCNWKQNDTGGIISSPNYPNQYPSNSRCKIDIMAPVNYIVNFTFTNLNVEPDSNCSYDVITIQEGLNSSDERLLKALCGTHQSAMSVLTTTKNVLFTFASDGFSEFSGFMVTYEFLRDPTKKRVKPTASPETTEDLFVHISPNATVMEGKRHAISCIPRSPTAKIRWYKGDDFVGGNNVPNSVKLVSQNTLEIEKMEAEHVDKYTCIIVSSEQSAVNATIWISMSFISEECDIILRDKPYDVTVTELIEFKLLECSSPMPNVTITWEKDGVPIQSSEKFTILAKGHLAIDKLEPKDAGFYTCVATGDDCEKREAAIVTVKPLVKIDDLCGLPKKGHPDKDKPNEDSGRIVGGSFAEKGAYPWQVMLWEPKQKTFCGGVLLNERWFLSVAHCFTTKRATEISWKQVRIRLGKLDQSEVETEEFSTTMDKVIIHPSFNIKTFDNDLALIRLKDEVSFTDYILPICLGEAKFIEEAFFNKENTLGVVTGWGRLTERGGVPRILKELQLPIVKKALCQSSTRNTVTRNMFCAGYAQEIVGDSCQGDSGGPFITHYEGRWYLPGLVSWGEGCAQKGKYGFYTKVNNYHSWIKNIIGTS